jgi:hypothetical protein
MSYEIGASNRFIKAKKMKLLNAKVHVGKSST